MNHDQAYQAMLHGARVRHSSFSDDEWLLIDSNGDIRDEIGCNWGGRFDEGWAMRKDWEPEWECVKQKRIVADWKSVPHLYKTAPEVGSTITKTWSASSPPANVTDHYYVTEVKESGEVFGWCYDADVQEFSGEDMR